jgi:hypothetical protein
MSLAGVTDKFEEIARIGAFISKLMGFPTTDEDIEKALHMWDLEPSTENVSKVRAYLDSYA